MKKIISFFCLLFVNFCNAESLEWHTGVVVLKSREVLTGTISINQVYDLLLLKQNDKVQVYPAHKIQQVRYYDAKSNVNRRFIVVEQKENALTHNHLFELVIVGEIDVLRKLSSALADPGDDAYSYIYYLRWHNEIIPMHKFRSDFYPRLMDASPAVTHFIQQNKFSPAFPSDVIQIIEFYNKQQNQSIVIGKSSPY